MSTDIDPIVDNWYQHLDKGQNFRVVAIDDVSGTVEIQHFDGDLEEVPIDEWYELELEPAEPPENWSGPLDVGEEDDLDTDISDPEGADWEAPLQEVKPTGGEEEVD